MLMRICDELTAIQMNAGRLGGTTLLDGHWSENTVLHATFQAKPIICQDRLETTHKEISNIEGVGCRYGGVDVVTEKGASASWLSRSSGGLTFSADEVRKTVFFLLFRLVKRDHLSRLGTYASN